MKLVKALAAIATVAALAGCGATTLEAESASEVTPVVAVAPVAQVPVTAAEDAAITFDIIEAVTVTVAPEVAAPVAAAPVVEEIAEVVIPEAVVPEVTVSAPAPVAAAPVAPAVEAPATEEPAADPVPFCHQDAECFVPVDAQDWVREITGITDLIVWEYVGVAWEKGENTCSTLDQVLCRVDFEDGTTSYYIHPDNVGKAGARAGIVEMFS